MSEHSLKTNQNSFSLRYKLHKVVHIETFNDPRIAIAREKQQNTGRDLGKIDLIKNSNPQFENLCKDYDKINYA